MFTIIAGALVSLLVFFFERWWTAHHPIAPTPEAKTAFIGLVHSKLRFKIIPRAKREKMAGALYDKFAAKYQAAPPVVDVSTKPLDAEQARSMACRYAAGLTLTEDEVG